MAARAREAAIDGKPSVVEEKPPERNFVLTHGIVLRNYRRRVAIRQRPLIPGCIGRLESDESKRHKQHRRDRYQASRYQRLAAP